MKLSLSIHRYTLRSRVSLNALSSRHEHEGVLIRVGEDGGYGYGCVHPWPELGDLTVEQILEFLADGRYVALVQRALACAYEDRKARGEGRSLFEGLAVPRSHATLIMDEGDFQRAVEAGFDIVKVKVGRDREGETEFIRSQASRFPGLRWRLDFNGALGIDEVEQFLGGLGAEVRGNIDFIEDAYCPGGSPWVDALGRYPIPMAVDREVEGACGGFDVAVIKPAQNVAGPILEQASGEGRRVVFTSYMDHPLGQCFAAWEAAVARRLFPDIVDTCGLVTHGLFEGDESTFPFIDCLGKPQPDFRPPAGTGLGFDLLLESLPWKLLS